MTGICKKCLEIKPSSEFSQRGARKFDACAPCLVIRKEAAKAARRAYNQAYVRANPALAKAWQKTRSAPVVTERTKAAKRAWRVVNADRIRAQGVAYNEAVRTPRRQSQAASWNELIRTGQV